MQLAYGHTHCFMNSEASENIFNVAKNARQLKGAKRFRKPERAMVMAIARGTLVKQFSFKPAPSKSLARGRRRT